MLYVFVCVLKYHLCASVSCHSSCGHGAHLWRNVVQARVGCSRSAQLSVYSRVSNHPEWAGVRTGHGQRRAQTRGYKTHSDVRCNFIQLRFGVTPSNIVVKNMFFSSGRNCIIYLSRSVSIVPQTYYSFYFTELNEFFNSDKGHGAHTLLIYTYTTVTAFPTLLSLLLFCAFILKSRSHNCDVAGGSWSRDL